MDILDCLYGYFTTFFSILIVVFLAAHFISWLRRPSALKLRSDSLVVLTGGCMGIGRHMALELASLYGCRIVIVDRRKDLFATIAAEVKTAGGQCECI
jgi:NADPH:quinone reductase-like Zn-dependent oxidoreductase